MKITVFYTKRRSPNRMEKCFIVTLFAAALLWSFLFSTAVAAPGVISNVGFIPSSIWFSKNPVFAGDVVRIYTVIFNGSEKDIRGTLEFYDGKARLGKINFTITGGGRAQDAWINWKATKGDHRISARIIEARASTAGGGEVAVALVQNTSGAREQFIDSDADGDGIGDKDDTDDDNDGISDKKEAALGTNPFNNDSDGDGILDGDDFHPLIPQKTTREKNGAASVKERVFSELPARFIAVARPIAQSLERFREKQGENAAKKRKEIKEHMQAEKRQAPSSFSAADRAGRLAEKQGRSRTNALASVQQPLQYALFLFFGALAFIFKYKFVFYIALAIVCYKLLKFAYRRMKRRAL